MSHHFISYDPIDSKGIAIELCNRLEKGLPKLSGWVTDIHLSDLEDIGEEVLEAIKTCKSLILIVSKRLADKNSRCHLEWKKAISYKKPILLVLSEESHFIPAKLESRRTYSFFRNTKSELKKLKETLQNIESDKDNLISLQEYLADALFDYEYEVDENKKLSIRNDIEFFQDQIAATKRGIIDPSQTEKRIMLGIEREKRSIPLSTDKVKLKFINEPPAEAPFYFQDRSLETSLIGGFIKSSSEKILIIDGRGGVGKTAMSCRVLKALEQGHMPDTGEKINIDGIIYMNAIGSHQIKFDAIAFDLVKLIDEEFIDELISLLNNPNCSVKIKTHALLSKIQGKSIVLLLDNFENELDNETNHVLKEELVEFFQAIIDFRSSSLKIIITTRYVPLDLLDLPPSKVRHIPLEGGLPSPFSELVLREMDTVGHVGLKNASDAELKSITTFTRGFPRALEAFYQILRADRNTSITEVLQNKYPVEKITEALVGEAFSRLSQIDQKIMQALAIYGFPVSPIAVDYVLSTSIPDIDSALHLKRLVNMLLVKREGREYYLHPIDREYSLKRLSHDFIASDDITDNNTINDLRLFAADYLKEVGKPRSEWKTLKDIDPQIHEFELRLQADDDYEAGYILTDLSEFLDERGGFSQKIRMAEELEKKSKDNHGRRVALKNLSEAYFRQGNIKKTIEIQNKLIDLLEKDQYKSEDLFYAKVNLIIFKSDDGLTEEEIDKFKSYVEDPKNEYFVRGYRNKSVIYHQLAIFYSSLGFYFKAFDYQKKAYEAVLKSNDIDAKEGETHNLATQYKKLNDILKAKELYKEAIKLSDESNNPLWKANHLSALAACYSDEDYTSKAIELTNEALIIRKQIGDLGGESDEYLDLAGYYLDSYDYNRAMSYAKQSIEISQNLGSSLVRDYLLVAKIHFMQSQFYEALDAIDKSLNYNKKGAVYDSELIKGIIYYRLRNIDASIKSFNKSIEDANLYIERCDINAGPYASKALALLGKKLCSLKRNAILSNEIEESIKLYEKARECNNFKGNIKYRLNLFNKLTEETNNNKLEKEKIKNAISGTEDNSNPVQISNEHETKESDANEKKLKGNRGKKKKILFISSCPRELIAPSADEQFNSIRNSITKEFLLLREGGVSPEDLLDVIDKYRPNIVHFFMHNSKEKGLYFQDGSGRLVPIRPETMGKIFSKAQESCNIECVVLNCCNSITHVNSLKSSIKNIIYTKDFVPDDKQSVATLFSEKFYENLSLGKSYKDAIERTKIALEAADPELPPDNQLTIREIFDIDIS